MKTSRPQLHWDETIRMWVFQCYLENGQHVKVKGKSFTAACRGFITVLRMLYRKQQGDK